MPLMTTYHRRSLCLQDAAYVDAVVYSLTFGSMRMDPRLFRTHACFLAVVEILAADSKTCTCIATAFSQFSLSFGLFASRRPLVPAPYILSLSGYTLQ